jgi:hypothetical protein
VVRVARTSFYRAATLFFFFLPGAAAAFFGAGHGA